MHGTDPLTGLPDSSAFASFAAADGSSLVLLDLTNIGGVIRRHGVAVGDDVIVAVSDQLRRAFPDATTFRIAEVEWAVVGPVPAGAPTLAEAAVAAAGADVGGIPVRGRAGVASLEHGGDASAALPAAEHARWASRPPPGGAVAIAHQATPPPTT